MNKIASFGVVIAGLLAVACADSPTGVGPQFDDAALQQHASAGPVGVITQNLYVGADVDAVELALMSEDPSDDFPALLTAIETLGKTDFPARAGAIADEIARELPHVVGFQEASVIHIDLSAFGGPTIDLSFLPIIEQALVERGLRYNVAATVKNLDVSLLGGAVRLVDYDAVLVNTDRVAVDYAYGFNFANNLGEIAPGVELKRGFAWVGATIDGVRYHIVSTHLEPDIGPYDLSDLRAAQAWEIAGLLTDSTPAFVMGDLNDPPGSPMYDVLRGAGFLDLWQELEPDDDGFTAGGGFTDEHPADLSDAVRGFTQRIDYIWARGVGHPIAGLRGSRVALFGEEPADKVDGPDSKIWPSDHAGLVAELLRPVATGLR